MLDYLISLLADAQNFSCGVAKASHAVLPCRLEQGEIGDYSCTYQIGRMRRANAQRHSKIMNDKKSWQKLPKQWLAPTLINIYATLIKHIRQRVSFADLLLLKYWKCFHTPRWIVIYKSKVKKMIRSGRTFTWKVYP